MSCTPVSPAAPPAQPNRKSRSGIMLAHPFEPRFLKPGTLVLQPKLNGVRCVAQITWTREAVHSELFKVSLFSSTGTSIPYGACPQVHLDLVTLFLNTPYKHLNHLFPPAESHSSIHLDGELYNHSVPFETISGLARRKTNFDSSQDLIQYHVFDIQKKQPAYLRVLDIETLFSPEQPLPKFSNLHQVPYSTISFCQPFADCLETITNETQAFLNDGYEGLIIRNGLGTYEYKRSRDLLKIKPDSFDYYQIYGFEEAISKYGDPLQRIGAFKVKDAEGRKFKVGSGRLSHQQAAQLFDSRLDLPGKWVQVAYLMRSVKNHVPTSARAIAILDSNPEKAQKDSE